MKRLFIIFLAVFSFLYSCKNKQAEDINFKHIEHIANSINSDLCSVKTDMYNLANVLQYKIPFDNEIITFPEEKYPYYIGNVLVCTCTESKSSVYYPADRFLTNKLKKIIVNSESLDTFFVNSLNNNPLLSQIYFLDTNSFLRIYPNIDVENYLKNSVDLNSFISYQTVKKKPFISDNAYWINHPFADPYGRGWIISCIEPIYYRDRFIGILSGDITINSLKDKYFSSGTESILLIDQKGEILCCTKEAGKIIRIPQIREYQYFKPVTENVFIYNNLSLTEHINKKVRTSIKSLLSGKIKASFYLDNKKYTIYKSYIRETDWLLLKIIK